MVPVSESPQCLTVHWRYVPQVGLLLWFYNTQIINLKKFSPSSSMPKKFPIFPSKYNVNLSVQIEGSLIFLANLINADKYYKENILDNISGG